MDVCVKYKVQFVFERAGETFTPTRGKLFLPRAICRGVHGRLQGTAHIPEVWMSAILDVRKRYLTTIQLKMGSHFCNFAELKENKAAEI